MRLILFSLLICFFYEPEEKALSLSSGSCGKLKGYWSLDIINEAVSFHPGIRFMNDSNFVIGSTGDTVIFGRYEITNEALIMHTGGETFYNNIIFCDSQKMILTRFWRISDDTISLTRRDTIGSIHSTATRMKRRQKE